jgi:hypothetical protein
MEFAFIFLSKGDHASRGILDIFRGLSDIAVVLRSFQLCIRRLDSIKIGKLFNAKYTTAKDLTV